MANNRQKNTPQFGRYSNLIIGIILCVNFLPFYVYFCYVETFISPRVPDSVAPVCMLCKKTQFTLIQRRVSTKQVKAFTCPSLLLENLSGPNDIFCI